MKKTILSITAFLSFIAVSTAQAPLGGFETWVATPSPSSSTDPVGWVSFNAVTLAGMQRTAFPETTAPYAGTTSVKLVTEVIPSTVMIPNPFNPAEDLDTVGLLAVGKFATIFPPTLKYGYTYAWRPATLSFACKYTPVAGDTAFVLAFLTKWNGTTRDTVAAGMYATGATTSSYAIQSLTMVYNPAFSAVMPDTEQVFISSSVFMHDGAKRGSAFYFDDWSWSGYVSTSDINGQVNNVTTFPSPASDHITFKVEGASAEMVEVLDITGRSVGMYQMSNNEVLIQTGNFKPGMYLYNVLNDKKQVINRNKFEVTK